MAVLTTTLTPFMGSVTATTAAQNLWTLLSALRSKLPHKACFLQMQLDTTAGSASLYVGNSDVSSLICAANLSANQAQLVYAFDSNLLILDQIYIIASAGEIQVNLTVVTR